MKSINEYIIQFDKTHIDTTEIGGVEMSVNPYFEQPEWINRIGKVVSTPILSPENAVIKSGYEVIVIHTSLLHESYKNTGRKESFFCVDIEKNLFRFEDNLIVMYRENSSQEWKCKTFGRRLEELFWQPTIWLRRMDDFVVAGTMYWIGTVREIFGLDETGFEVV